LKLKLGPRLRTRLRRTTSKTCAPGLGCAAGLRRGGEVGTGYAVKTCGPAGAESGGRTVGTGYAVKNRDGVPSERRAAQTSRVIVSHY
jgi:hypothetical protein